MLPPKLERELLEGYGVTNIGPKVAFIDWALKDDNATAAAGRPKYRDVIFIEKRPRDGTRDVFRRVMEETDKQEFAREWAEYLERKNALNANSPKVGLIPGMTRARFEELSELGIVTCADLVAYEGNLDELEPMRSVAKRIMEACNAESGKVREERQDIREALGGSPDSVVVRPWAGGTSVAPGFISSIPGTASQAPQKAVETFRYSFG